MFLANADYTNPYHDASDGRRMLAWIAEEDDGRAVGFAVGFYGGLSSFSSTWEFCLHDLFVHPGARRKGLAKLFFKHIADKVIPYVGVISFEVLDWNINAIKLYEGLGAHYCGERIEPDGTTWKQMQIKGDAFMALVRAREASWQKQKRHTCVPRRSTNVSAQSSHQNRSHPPQPPRAHGKRRQPWISHLP